MWYAAESPQLPLSSEPQFLIGALGTGAKMKPREEPEEQEKQEKLSQNDPTQDYAEEKRRRRSAGQNRQCVCSPNERRIPSRQQRSPTPSSAAQLSSTHLPIPLLAGISLEAPTVESPLGAFSNPGTMSYGDELTPEALSVPSGFDDLITTTTSQVLQAMCSAASAIGRAGQDRVLSMMDKLPDSMSNIGDLEDLPGLLTSEVVSQDEQVQFWLVLGYTVVVFAAILGNWLLNHVIMKYKKVHTASGLFVVNISVTNMMLALLSSPFTMVRYVCNSLALGKMTCHLSCFAQFSCAYVTVMTMAAISLDRHRVMLYPLKSRITLMQGNVCIIIIWILSTCAALPHAIYQKPYQVKIGNSTEDTACLPSFPYTSKFTRKYLDLSTFLLFFILPLMVLLVVYGHVAKKLWIHNAVDDINIHTYICQRGKKKQTLKMLLTVVLAYTVSWLPLNLYLVLLSTELISSHNDLYFFLHWLAISSSCYNPYIYCWLSDSFRIEVQKVIAEVQKMMLDKISRLRGEHQQLRSASPTHHPILVDTNPGVPKFPRFKDFDELPSPPPSPVVEISFIYPSMPRV
ncbi:probable G-protein coupled receptor 83 [Octodon degus]|uniref:Probable G-protein coupled receptor 83 n=1 Tax=Octodon degus TaxID=10160 RepID=A0A6P3VEG7_OCTDE|nr:probable G-protein coupled receptor 83 [Octodon degus]